MSEMESMKEKLELILVVLVGEGAKAMAQRFFEAAAEFKSRNE